MIDGTKPDPLFLPKGHYWVDQPGLFNHSNRPSTIQFQPTLTNFIQFSYFRMVSVEVDWLKLMCCVFFWASVVFFGWTYLFTVNLVSATSMVFDDLCL